MKYNDNGIWKDLTVKVSDTLPIGTELDYDGNTVPTGWEQITNPNGYSTNEVKTNKIWIDNKPIYRKTITGNFTVDSKAHGISNLVAVTKIEGTFYNGGSGSYFPIPSTRPAYPGYEVGIYIDSTNVNFEKGSGVGGANMTWIVTLEYTKSEEE